MEFKIDTNDNYTVVTTVSDQLNENLTAALSEKWTELLNNGVNNIIIDMNSCKTVDETVMTQLIKLHETLYGENHSIVFTNLQIDVRNKLQKLESFQDINVAPTMDEAIDIVSMEMLERDLLAEEEEGEE